MGERTIRFLQEYVKQNSKTGTAAETRHAAGKVLTVREDAARWYIKHGLAEDAEATPSASLKPPPSADSQDGANDVVEVPEDWETNLKWQDLRALASTLTDVTVRSKNDARAAIEMALENGTARLGSPIGEDL